MFDFLIGSIGDAFLDTIKLIPFLLVTYLVMEWLEHKTGSRTQAWIRKAGKTGPFFGGILGIFPQCGFSTAASNLYAGGLITAGALVAVFLSTSDEMLPIFISEAVPVNSILKILAVKMLLAIVSGFVLDFLYHKFIRKEIRYKNIHAMCESEHCKCEEGILFSAIRHTLHITLFIFLFTLALNFVIEGVGEEQLARVVQNVPVVGELLAALVGLIPNCASSVVITELYIQGVIGSGPMIAGLLSSSGVGMLVLFRMNRKHPKQNLGMVLYLYVVSVIWGILIDLLGIGF